MNLKYKHKRNLKFYIEYKLSRPNFLKILDTNKIRKEIVLKIIYFYFIYNL